MPKIIGFYAQYQSGKDLAADYLCDKLNEMNEDKWYRGSLGKAVKAIFGEHFGFTAEEIEYWKVKTETPPGLNGPLRDGLTKIGDGWRDTKQDIWINKLFGPGGFGENRNLVVSDGRYLNESEAFRGMSKLHYMKNHKGIAILIWRPGFENNKQSRSEQEIMPFVRQLQKEPDGIIDNPEIPFDVWLKNDGTKEEWFAKIDNIVIPYVKQKLS